MAVFFVVDCDVLPTASLMSLVSFENVDFFFLVSRLVLAVRKGGREGGVAIFVTFPSDVRSPRR